MSLQLNVSLEKEEGIERTVKVSVPNEHFEQQVQKKIQDLLPSLKIDGFRPGKVPFQVAQQRFGESIRWEVAQDVLKETLGQAIEESQLEPVALPLANIVDFSKGNPFVYTLQFEIRPSITVKDFNGQSLERIKAELTDAEFEELINDLREQQAEFVAQEKIAEAGDVLELTIRVFQEGHHLSQEDKKEARIKLNPADEKWPSEFYRDLVGKKAGDTVEIYIDTPPHEHEAEHVHDEHCQHDHAQEEQKAGAPSKKQYIIQVQKVGELKLPPLDEAFIAKFDVKEGGVEAFREKFKSRIQQDMKQKVLALHKERVFKAFMQMHDFTIPQTLVRQEAEHLMQNAIRRAQELKIPTKFFEHIALFESEASYRVALGLLVAEYVKQHDIKPHPENVKKLVTESASAYQNPDEIIEWIYKEPARLKNYEIQDLELQVLEKLFDSAKVEEKKVGYKELMKMQ